MGEIEGELTMSQSDLMQARPLTIPLPDRGGDVAGLEFGPTDRPIDLVFSHANGFNARTYCSILGPLATDFRILALDQRGHGLTRLPTVLEGRNSWDQVAEDLLAVILALDLGDVTLAGHSMGGTSSLLASARCPDRVKALVLFDPVIIPAEFVASIPPGESGASPLAQGALKRRAEFPSKAAVIESYTGKGAFRSWSPTMLADYVEDGFRDTPQGTVTLACAPAWEASNFSSQGHDTAAAFDLSQAPTHILKAEIGSTCRIETREEALLATGRYRIETVPGASHFLPMERPDLVVASLKEAMS